jgi:hypothetical protein
VVLVKIGEHKASSLACNKWEGVCKVPGVSSDYKGYATGWLFANPVSAGSVLPVSINRITIADFFLRLIALS